MLHIDCPWCGLRDETEFRWGGEAGVAHPHEPEALDDRAWAAYLFVRANPAGELSERWCHDAGCRRWFVARRDTCTHAIVATAPLGALG